jgi:hypothetical protein
MFACVIYKHIIHANTKIMSAYLIIFNFHIIKMCEYVFIANIFIQRIMERDRLSYIVGL